MNWKEQKVLITGASRGLGAALAEALASRGAAVALVARHPGPLNEVVQRIRARGGTAFAIVADVADKEATHAISGQAAAVLGRIDVLLHNASTLGPVPLKPLLDTECESLAEVLETNVVGPFRLTKAVLGPMVLRRSGVVLWVSSDAAVEGYPGWGSYGASKAAADQLMRVLAAEVKDAGVRVLSVDPGEMDTQMHRDAMPEADPATLARPAAVAERVIAALDDETRAPTGARVLAAQWVTA
jgi:NAD(P)-dependent dehydrogenase (short-subunit alcohol dehydrogenase family)